MAGPQPSIEERVAIQIWNQFGGDIQWQALPWVAEMYGVDDLELLTAHLMAIREHRQEDLRTKT